MTFKKFVCWGSDRVHRVMNVEATQPLDHVFLATHHPVAMYRQELTEAPSRVEYDEKKFLKDFLAEEDFAFVPVLGGSGTGKSHLIRWLKANIESTKHRRVLLIPKIGTNLKDIIRLILEGMEGEKFDKYRQRLNKATSRLTEAQARVQLLNQLAAAVGPNGRHERTQISDEQNYLVNEIDSLLYDPFFREHWLKDGGIIHRLVIHTVGHQDIVEIIEERRQFSIDDLPLNVLNLQKAGKQAQEFYAFLIGNDEIQRATVEWLNRHLDEAITQVLSLGREDLQILMREVRETLAEQGTELVLLIEDFAKLQGIDREVLEAVLARPQQPGRKPLCSIRTALACTTGYFQGLIDTVRQRVTFSVNLDIGTVSDDSLITQTKIQQFVARYLNAVRLEDEAILNWATSRNQEEDSEREPLLSACDGCEHRQPCHAGFEEANGMGFYPFTPKALEQMLSHVNQRNFNPRILIKDVLKYTLETSHADIEQGRFPSVSLLEHFGGQKLNVMLSKRLEAKDPQNFARREVLLKLWTDGSELRDLRPEVHIAFDLPPLGDNPPEIVLPPKPPAGSTLKPESPLAGLAEKLESLDKWRNGDSLSQNTAQELRKLVFPAIKERIEWDTEMLLQGKFAGDGSKLFMQRNVVFHEPQGLKTTIAGIKLLLPLKPSNPTEFRETAIALKGILQYSHYKHWKFPDAASYFRTYTKQLERWSDYILEQIHCRPRLSGEPWNPVPASVELLAIAARMAGHSTNSLEDLVNALFIGLDKNDEENRASAWQKIFKSLKQYREPLLDIIESRIACTKGSTKPFQIIDATQIIAPLKKVSKDWQPKCDIPEDLRSKEFDVIQKARQQVDELLEQAVQEERDRQLEVYQALVAEFGEELNHKEAIEAIKQAMEQAREAGVFGQMSADSLTTVLDKFKRTPLASYMTTMKRVQTESDIGKLLQYLSENHQRAMTTASEFLRITKNFFETSLNRADTDVRNLQAAEGGTVESSHQAIQAGLADLRSLVTEIKGGQYDPR